MITTKEKEWLQNVYNILTEINDVPYSENQEIIINTIDQLIDKTISFIEEAFK